MLSYAQESLWLLHEMARPDEPAYNESVAFAIDGQLDPDALRHSVHATIQRHESLRTAFVDTAVGPRAEIRESAPDNLTFVDLREEQDDTARARADELMARHHRSPFDLGAAPLLRTMLVALPGDAWILVLTAHHIVIDDWSIRLILNEIAENYRTLVTIGRLPERSVSGAAFRQFVAASRELDGTEGQAEKIGRWRQSLLHRPEVLGMPLDRPRPAAQTFRGDSVTLTVGRAAVEPLLRECARTCRSTPFSVFLAAYAVLLQRYTRQDGFVIGTTVLNRPSDADLEQVGCYVNTLPLFVAVNPEDTFRTVLGAAQTAANRLLDDGDVPYPKLIDALGVERPRNHNPLFQTMLTMLGGHPEIDLGAGLRSVYRSVRRIAAKFDLMLYVSVSEAGYEFEIEFNTDLFTPETAERLLRNYAQLLTSLATTGIDTAVSVPSMLREEERRLILDEWNDTRTEYPGGTVVDIIEEQVRRSPEALAVEFGNERWSYERLNRQANRVANRVRRVLEAAEAGPFVGVYMERSVEMVVALLAIVKAGYAYVPIDPDYPPARVDFMIRDADLPLILTQERHRSALGSTEAQVLVLPEPTRPDENDTNPNRRLGPDSPVYMIYTSGSTGQPKGVINRHSALANRLHWMQSAYPLSGDDRNGVRGDRVLQKTPYSFDVSVWEFFWPLMFGAAIVVAKPGGHRDPDYLAELIHSSEVSTVHFVPSMLNVFLEVGALADRCRTLKRVICSGEALPRRTLDVFFATLPSCELHNLYGPTEAAIDVSAWACTPDYPAKLVPIGKPIANVRLYVLDENLRLQPIGVPGELCIGGVAVATGYHHRDELSARVFVGDPYSPTPGGRLYRTGDLARFLPDGQIQYLGRIDNQVKLHGLRVEPDEIAAVLRQIETVQDAAVVVYDSGNSQALAAYVVCSTFDPDDLRGRLRVLLPEFLVPQYVIDVPALPTTPNGKLDRRALPAPTTVAATPADRAGVAPSTEAERDVARVWQEVLGAGGPLGVESNFFALGGDSIMALRVVSRLRAAGYAVSVRDVFTGLTIKELAASLTPDAAPAANLDMAAFTQVSEEDRASLPPMADDAWPLTKLQSGMIYHSLLDADSPVYHDIFDYELVGGITDVAHLSRAIRETVRGRAQLRSYFDLERFSEPLQVVLSPDAAGAQPSMDLVDISHLPGGLQDQVVEEWIENEKRRPFDLAKPPIRFCVHVRSASRANLTLSFHHSILDGWSVALVVDEIRRRYAELSAGGTPDATTPAEPSYGAYVALERAGSRRPENHAAWRSLLDGFAATLLAGRHGSVSASEIEVSLLERTVPAALERRLRARAASLGIPLKSLYLAAHCESLARHTGVNRVVTGLVGNGRPEIPGGADMVGLFLNTLPFPVNVGDADNSTLPSAVFERERELLPLQNFPLADIEQQHGGPLFDVAFNYTDFHTYADAPGSVSIDSARYFELTNFPMTVHVHFDHFAGSMQVAVAHDAARIKAGAVEAFLDDFLAALVSYDTGRAAGGDVHETERVVAGVIAQAVGREELGAGENYLEAGVDSITSIRILVKLRKLFPKVAMRDVMEARTVRALVRRIGPREPAGGAAQTSTGWTADPVATTWPRGVVDGYPITATQLRMIRATRRDPAQSAYHDVFAYSVALPLDEPVLRARLRRMVESCETMRTAFDLDASPEPLQLVYASVEPSLIVVDAVGNAAAVDEWFERERGSGFDWSRPRLIRFAAHRTAADQFVLSLSFHHAIVDGWSLSLLVRELLLSYAAELGGGASPTEAGVERRPGAFRDYVMAEVAARASAESRNFWRGVLADHPGTTLPRYRPGEGDARWAETTLAVAADREAQLRNVARRVGLPLKHVLLAAHLRVLAMLTGDSDVVSGVFTHGRPETDDAEALVGMFLQFQPHRVCIGTQTWLEITEQVFAFEMRAVAHRECAASTATAGELRYAALFNYTEFPAYAEVSAGRGHLTDVRWFEHTDAPLLATVGRDPAGSGLEITLNADGRLLPPAVIEDVARLYSAVLAQIAEDPESRVQDVTAEIRACTESLRARQRPPV
ncbi:amino acid adenylation domain-containing protein [Micromonospora marina]|uniref:amino acid adenylation domain-containing protein n=1 Tax=Micromonospora marina TaxID=307120 RepID=UPI003D70DE9F